MFSIKQMFKDEDAMGLLSECAICTGSLSAIVGLIPTCLIATGGISILLLAGFLGCGITTFLAPCCIPSAAILGLGITTFAATAAPCIAICAVGLGCAGLIVPTFISSVLMPIGPLVLPLIECIVSTGIPGLILFLLSQAGGMMG